LILQEAFKRYIGIDYSSAETPIASLKGLRVYMADRDTPPIEVLPPTGAKKYWTRRGIADWLAEVLSEDVPTLVSIDHGFSLLFATSQRIVRRSIGERFWRTFSAIGRRMMTILMSISCVRETAAMRPRDSVMQSGGASRKSALVVPNLSSTLTCRDR
jgi:hypothetical protein